MKRKLALFHHAGGKNAEKGQSLVAFFPKDMPDIYIEPYGGSFGVANQSGYNPEKILMVHNDLDNIVHAIFKAVANCPEKTLDAVFNLLEKYDYDESTVAYLRFVFNYQQETGINILQDDIYLGAAGWLLKFMTKNGECKELMNTKEMDVRAGMDKLFKSFENREETAYDMEGVVTLSMDAMDILRTIKANGRNHTFQILLYIDAPYSHSGKRTTKQDLYRVDIDKDDVAIVELAELLEEINKVTDCKMIVSEYDNPIYNRILTEENGWNKTAVGDFYKSMAFSKFGESKPIETEYVWRNYTE